VLIPTVTGELGISLITIFLSRSLEQPNWHIAAKKHVAARLLGFVISAPGDSRWNTYILNAT
jgi:hypothetical protein